MPEKLYLQAQDLLEDAFRLGAMIVNSGYRPNYIVGVWRGGVPVGIAVQEFLASQGIKADHISIRTSNYSNAIDHRQDRVRIHGLRYLIDRVNFEDRILFVDDVFDTGLTMQGIIEKLRRKARLNAPEHMRIAVPWYKPTRRQSTISPDYYLHETDQWIKFPHSLEGLTEEEIQKNRPKIAEILAA